MRRFLTVATLATISLAGLSACAGTAADRPTTSPTTTPAVNTAPAKDSTSPASAPAAGVAAAKLKNADGSTFTIADVPGKAKVVNVWATWCAPCIGEMPILNAMAKEYAAKDVTFVAISVDEGGPQDVEPVLKRGKVKVDFRQAYASFDDLEPINVVAPIPDTLVFDASNRLVKHFDKVVEKAELEAAINEALGAKGT
jgi:thiol-disulfide isomerase/thioredoxin